MSISIAVDIMSGDTLPKSRIDAVQKCKKRHPDIEFILVGDKTLIEKELGKAVTSFVIEHAEAVVRMDDLPTRAIRKRNTSMRIALELVKKERAQAAISAGNTGALMGLGVLILKLLHGIERPAIASFIPCRNDDDKINSFCLLDMGANANCKPEMLYEFSLMGIAFCKIIKKIENPKVALLNIGEEHYKGNDLLHKSAELLQSDKAINYIGYIEGSKMFTGKANVVVTDGFTGNIVLKVTEGLASMILRMIKDAFTENKLSRSCAFFAMPVLNKLKQKMDSRAYNGACLLGLNGIVVKSHGNADSVAFSAAIECAIDSAEQNLPKTIANLLDNKIEVYDSVKTAVAAEV